MSVVDFVKSNLQFILLAIAFMFFMVSVSAAIEDYKVAANIKLNEILSVDGTINPPAQGIQCSFRVYELDGTFVKRLTDEYTTSNGVFSSSYYSVREPPFQQNFDYNVVTDCDGNFATATFTLAEPRDLNNFFFGTINWLMDNIQYLIVILGVIIVGIILLALFLAKR